jgi:lipopolysaccharide export system permease protein
VKILPRYVLKEHAGPLAFALGALTSLMLLNYVAKRLGELVGKGLPWTVFVEFFGLALGFIVAMVLPMAVLVATLYAFSRLAAENEITALRASGVGMRRVLAPVLWAAAVVTLVMIVFNDQIMPRSNHRLSVLQRDIAQKKPTFALREQIINELSRGRLYLRAGHLDENSNRMREITIYDFADPTRRRTIFADSGNLAMSPDQSDLIMTLYEGTLQDVPTGKPEQLQRLFFRTDRVRVRGVGNQFRKTEAETYKGEREMTVCEMSRAQNRARVEYLAAQEELREKVATARRAGIQLSEAVLRTPLNPPRGKSWGSLYCSGIQSLASLVRPARAQPAPATQQRGVAAPTQQSPQAAPVLSDADRAMIPALLESARIRMGDNERIMNLYGVEIHKKFALAVACFVFVLLGAPIALRFPRGGVGLVIGVSIIVFGLYYVALTFGQSLGTRGVVPPVVAMWAANALFGALAVVLLARIGREGVTARGGDTRELLETMRAWGARQLVRIGIRAERRRRYR